MSFQEVCNTIKAFQAQLNSSLPIPLKELNLIMGMVILASIVCMDRLTKTRLILEKNKRPSINLNFPRCQWSHPSLQTSSKCNSKRKISKYKDQMVVSSSQKGSLAKEVSRPSRNKSTTKSHLVIETMLNDNKEKMFRAKIDSNKIRNDIRVQVISKVILNLDMYPKKMKKTSNRLQK